MKSGVWNCANRPNGIAKYCTRFVLPAKDPLIFTADQFITSRHFEKCVPIINARYSFFFKSIVKLISRLFLNFSCIQSIQIELE